MRFLYSLFMILLLSNPFCSQDVAHANDSRTDCYVVTIPKSGSHLIVKLLTMFEIPIFVPVNVFTGIGWIKYPGDPEMNSISEIMFERMMLDLKKKQFCLVTHMNYSGLLQRFSITHPEYIQIIHIRDLRDILVSYVYWEWNYLETILGPSTFSQKLLFLITEVSQNDPSGLITMIFKHAMLASSWLDDPNIILCRFEDLVGERGGGDEKKQRQLIKTIAQSLNMPLTSLQLSWIVKNLFGNETMPDVSGIFFRRGIIGSWKEHFEPIHLEMFNKIWGDLQLKLGYTLDQELL